MRRTATISPFLIVSLLILGAAIFAKELGLASDSNWGKGRIVLLIFGLLVALIPWVIKRDLTASDKATHNDLFAFPVLLAVIVIYFWFARASHGLTSNYYSLLATSFRNGELSLPLTPNPALLQLPNPYDPAARQGIKAPLDLSLYNRKFYLYWGPAPALLLAIAQPVLPGQIGEGDLLFVFMCGIFLSQFLFIMNFWQRFFSGLPKWILILSISLAGLANPTLWLFGQPKIYAAAIAGAQFFFIAGFVVAVLALERQPVSNWRLSIAGTFWALAVGTRSVQVFPVVFMTLIIIYWFFKNNDRSLSKILRGLISLGFPLFIGALAFCWYNWTRFGSILETGFTYQLAGPYLQKHINELFLPDYIFQNLYNYLFHPFTIKQSFPFLYPLRGLSSAILPWQVLPEFYMTQAVTGFLCAVPFTVFAILPGAISVKQFFTKKQTPTSGENSVSFPGWITVSLIGSFALPFLSLLAFFWAAMRYAEDFMPALLLLSIIGFWQGYQYFSGNSRRGKIYTILGVTLAVLSILIAILLGVSIYSTGSVI